MGFVASQEVEELTYDFSPYSDAHGTIPEPTTRQVETFRNALMGSVETLGLTPEQLTSGKIDFAMVGDLIQKANAVEQSMVDAVADVTGIANSVLNGLPYRPKAAFCGWIVGVFLRPEAQKPATTS
jgi:hypothetical protein